MPPIMYFVCYIFLRFLHYFPDVFSVVSASLAFLEQVSTLEEKASLLAKLASRAESAVNVLDECQAALETESERVSSTVHTSFQRVIDSFVARRSHLLDEVGG